MTTDAARLTPLLDRQLELFRRLDALSQLQSGLIAADDTDRLLGVLAERQVVVDQIGDANDQLEPIRARWEVVLASLGAPERRDITAQIEALARLAASISDRDESDRLQLEQRRDAVAGELKGVSRGRAALGAYGQPRGGPRFQDREA